MVDLHRLIQEGYYSKHAGGSISLKFMLPAVLKDAQEVANLYRKSGLYGAGLAVESLNFQGPVGHTWLQADKGDDPYKTLPGIFGVEHGVLNDMLMLLAGLCLRLGTVERMYLTGRRRERGRLLRRQASDRGSGVAPRAQGPAALIRVELGRRAR